jgi:hypothetical protein
MDGSLYGAMLCKGLALQGKQAEDSVEGRIIGAGGSSVRVFFD